MRYFIDRFLFLCNQDIMAIVVSFIPLLPIFILFFRKKYINHKILKLIVGYVFFDLLFNIFTIVLAIYKVHSIIYFNLYYLFESIFWGVIAYLLNPYKTKRIVICLLSIILLIIAFFEITKTKTAYIEISFSRLILVIYSFFYFHTLLSEQKVKNLLVHPPFFINAGLMIYGMSSIILSLFIDYIFKLDTSNYISLFGIIRIITILFFILLGVAFWVTKYENKLE